MSYYRQFARRYASGRYHAARIRMPRYGRSGSSNPLALAGAAAAVAVLASAGTAAAHHHHHAGRPSVADIVVPARNSYTPRTWAVAFLHVIREPETACNIAFVVAWEHAEGGHWGNTAAFNPLDSERVMPGSRGINHTPGGGAVQAYVSWQQGLRASRLTILNGHYPAILAALAAGNDAQRAATAAYLSPWGTEEFGASC